MAEEVVSLCASGGQLSVTHLLSLLFATWNHLPGISRALPQLHFRGGSGKEWAEEQKTELMH